MLTDLRSDIDAVDAIASVSGIQTEISTNVTSGIRQWCESLFMYLNMFMYMIIKINYIFNFK